MALGICITPSSLFFETMLNTPPQKADASQISLPTSSHKSVLYNLPWTSMISSLTLLRYPHYNLQSLLVEPLCTSISLMTPIVIFPVSLKYHQLPPFQINFLWIPDEMSISYQLKTTNLLLCRHLYNSSNKRMNQQKHPQSILH